MSEPPMEDQTSPLWPEPQHRRWALALCLGTACEGYDLGLFVALAPLLATQFLPGQPEAGVRWLLALAVGIGLLVRPLGALLFGHLGDMVGRKSTFLISLILMGLSTSLVAVLPTELAVGLAAPVMLVGLRIMQGLAQGGEHGGALVLMAEHAPPAARGRYAACIPLSAALGLALALVLTHVLPAMLPPAAFEAWGWRLLFTLPLLLLAVSAWIRFSMAESPVFRRLAVTCSTAKAPVREVLGEWRHLRPLLLMMAGLVAGQAVVTVQAQGQALAFLTEVLRLEADTAALLMALALLVSAPLYVVFGALSDRLGRKPLVVGGLLLSALTSLVLFKLLALATHPDWVTAQSTSPVVVQSAHGDCTAARHPWRSIGVSASGCDRVSRVLLHAGVSHRHEVVRADSPAAVRVGAQALVMPASGASPQAWGQYVAELTSVLRAHGHPVARGPDRVDAIGVSVVLGLLLASAAMVAGPAAAWLVERFPARLRYTSVSFAHHAGHGLSGGLVPVAAVTAVAFSGQMADAVLYPAAMAVVAALVCLRGVAETRTRRGPPAEPLYL